MQNATTRLVSTAYDLYIYIYFHIKQIYLRVKSGTILKNYQVISISISIFISIVVFTVNNST